MTNHFYHYIAALTLPLLISVASAEPVETNSYGNDKRIGLVMNEEDKAKFLAEKRQMLKSIQGVITGIGTNNRELIYESAKSSGKSLARQTPKAVVKILPKKFKNLGGPMHKMFEELATRSKTDEMDVLAKYTGKLMQQCVDCHEMYKIE
jgi:hypothetical protein